MNPVEDWLTQPGGLAARLREIRVASRLSGKQLADAAGWQQSKVSRLENGRQMPSEDDITTWVQVCQADPQATTNLVAILHGIEADRSDFRRRMRQGQRAVELDYETLERDSKVIRYCETVWVPGLLQTPDYARRVRAEMVRLHRLDNEDVDAAVAVRMRRQQVLYMPEKQFEFLIAEPVIRWLLPSVEVMRGQLDRLQTVIGMPNIRFGILPMGVPLATTPQNAFQIFDDLAVAESFVGEHRHDEEQSEAYARFMDMLWDEAVEGDAARRLIVAAAEALGSAR